MGWIGWKESEKQNSNNQKGIRESQRVRNREKASPRKGKQTKQQTNKRTKNKMQVQPHPPLLRHHPSPRSRRRLSRRRRSHHRHQPSSSSQPPLLLIVFKTIISSLLPNEPHHPCTRRRSRPTTPLLHTRSHQIRNRQSEGFPSSEVDGIEGRGRVGGGGLS